MVYIDDKEFVLADIPGLIENASIGKGLGDKFLKHIERCGVVLHLIDITGKDIVKDYKTIRGELENYGNQLKSKSEIIALNKIDALNEKQIKNKVKLLQKEIGKDKKIFIISAVTKQGTAEVLRALYSNIEAYRNTAEK